MEFHVLGNDIDSGPGFALRIHPAILFDPTDHPDTPALVPQGRTAIGQFGPCLYVHIGHLLLPVRIRLGFFIIAVYLIKTTVPFSVLLDSGSLTRFPSIRIELRLFMVFSFAGLAASRHKIETLKHRGLNDNPPGRIVKPFFTKFSKNEKKMHAGRRAHTGFSMRKPTAHAENHTMQ
jgi:hypothetical protein